MSQTSGQTLRSPRTSDRVLTIRRRYRLIGTEVVLGQKRYIWQSVHRMPGDSRVEQFTCGADWFWSHR